MTEKLVLKVDSKQVQTATRHLERLAAAALAVDKAVGRKSSAFERLNRNMALQMRSIQGQVVVQQAVIRQESTAVKSAQKLAQANRAAADEYKRWWGAAAKQTSQQMMGLRSGLLGIGEAAKTQAAVGMQRAAFEASGMQKGLAGIAQAAKAQYSVQIDAATARGVAFQRGLRGIGEAAKTQYSVQMEVAAARGKALAASQKEIVATQRILDRQTRALSATQGRAQRSVRGLTSEMILFRGTAAGVAIAGIGSAFAALGDNAVKLDARLKLITKTSQERKQVEVELLEIANQNRQSLLATTDLYIKTATALQKYNQGARAALSVTNAVSAALLVGGANARESSAAQIQLAQAFSAGVLRGDEFRSIAESSPRLLKAIADGAGIAQSELRGMAEKGLLTATLVMGSLIKEEQKLTLESRSFGFTVGGAFNILGNAALDTAKKVNEQTDATGKFARSIIMLKPLIDLLGSALIALINILTALSPLLIAAAGYFTAMGLRAIYVAAVLPALVRGLALLRAAMLAIAVAGLPAFLMSLVTPVGLLAAAVVGLTYAWMKFKDVSSENIEADADLEKMQKRIAEIKQAMANPSADGLRQADAMQREQDFLEMARKQYEQQGLTGERLEKQVATALELYQVQQKYGDLLIKMGMKAPDAAKPGKIDPSIALRAELAILVRVNELLREGRTLEEASFVASFEALSKEGKALERNILIQKKANDGLSDQLKLREDLRKQAEDEETVGRLMRGQETAGGVITGDMDESRARNLVALSRIDDPVVREQQARLDASRAANAEFEKQRELLKQFLEMDVSSSLGDGFDKATQSLSSFVNTFERLVGEQKKYNDLIEGGGMTAAEAAAAQQKFQMQQIGTYADMAGAAKGFFKEGSKGYKALQKAEQVFRAFQFAMQVKSLVVTAATEIPKMAIFAKTAQAAALTVPPPFSFVALAATIAALAAAGVAFKKGGGYAGPSAASLGQGTVLGDSSKPSESLANSLELLESYGKKGLEYYDGMLSQLRSINRGINGLGTLLVRANFATSGGSTPFNFADQKTSLFGLGGGGTADKILNEGSKAFFDFFTLGLNSGAFGNVFGSLFSSIVGGIASAISSKKTVQQNSGILFDAGQTLGSVLSDGIVDGAYFAVLQTTRRTFGIRTGGSASVVTQALDAETGGQFGKVIGQIASVTIGAIDLLLGASNGAEEKLRSLKLSALGLTEVSLQGLPAEEVNKRLSAVFSAFSDTLARELIPQISKFQQVGEGLFDTLVRVASQTSAVKNLLENIGLGLSGTGLSPAEQAQQLADLAGGFDRFSEGISGFYENFFSQDEQLARTGELLGRALGTIGLSLPGTRQGFRQLVTGMDLTTASGQEAFTTLVGLSSAADEYYKQVEQAAESTDKLVESLRDLVDEMNRLILATGTPTQQIANQRIEFLSRTNLAMQGDRASAEMLPQLGRALAESARLGSSSQADYIRELAFIRNASQGVADLYSGVAAPSIMAPSAGATGGGGPMVATNLQPGSNVVNISSLISEVQGLRSDMAASQFAIAKNTDRTARKLELWDGDGLPEERNVA